MSKKWCSMPIESYISASFTKNLTSSRPSVAESLMLLLSLRFVSLRSRVAIIIKKMCIYYLRIKRCLTIPKRMNFRKSSEGGGGGSFPIQKFMLQNLDFWTGLFWHKNDTKGYFQGMFFNNLKRNFKKKFSWDTLVSSNNQPGTFVKIWQTMQNIQGESLWRCP